MSHHRYNEHHWPPKSRGGMRKVELPRAFHQAWHVVFQDMTTEEIKLFITDLLILFKQKDKITAGDLHDLRKEIKECGSIGY